MVEKLQKLIEILISKNKEGEYWDYKREWHKSNGKLLHDILCFANTIHDRNCFIILGYYEEEGLIGVSKNNRKKQADALDMLSNIRFSGGNVPRIKVNTVTIEKKEIDILEICNSYELPFFITTKFQEVNSGLIYSRIGDTNTAINESTNIYIMQGIWKKRFRLNQPAINQFQNLLTRKEEWFKNSEGWYNIFQPDFYIVEEDDDRYKYPEFYSYVMTNENTSYRNVKLMVHGTEIDSHQIVLLDSGIYKTSVPTW